jgi:hypothetical protein
MRPLLRFEVGVVLIGAGHAINLMYESPMARQKSGISLHQPPRLRGGQGFARLSLQQLCR